MKNFIRSPLLAASISLLLGLMGGSLAYLLIKIYLPPPSLDLPKVSTEKTISSTILLPTESVLQKLSRQLVFIYTDKRKLDGDQEIWLPENFLGYGALITNNGWLVTNADVKNAPNAWVTDWQNKSYAVKQAVNDEVGGVNYLKIDMEKSEVVDFYEEIDKNLTQEFLFIANGVNYLQPIKINELLATELVTKNGLSSIKNFSRWHQFTPSINANRLGLPVINAQGRVIGLVKDEQTILPSVYFTAHLNDVLQNQKINRPKINLDYYDLALMPHNIVNDGVTLKYGALINLASPSLPLKIGDVVTGLNNVNLSQEEDLTIKLQRFHSGDEVNLTVIRDEKVQNISFVLP